VIRIWDWEGGQTPILTLTFTFELCLQPLTLIQGGLLANLSAWSLLVSSDKIFRIQCKTAQSFQCRSNLSLKTFNLTQLNKPPRKMSHKRKILEAILKVYIMRHITAHSLINASQHGFLSRRSCLINLSCN